MGLKRTIVNATTRQREIGDDLRCGALPCNPFAPSAEASKPKDHVVWRLCPNEFSPSPMRFRITTWLPSSVPWEMFRNHI
jgi:hypothetical protein